MAGFRASEAAAMLSAFSWRGDECFLKIDIFSRAFPHYVNCIYATKFMASGNRAAT